MDLIFRNDQPLQNRKKNVFFLNLVKSIDERQEIVSANDEKFVNFIKNLQ